MNFEYLRSANLVRDIDDSSFLKRYITSPFIDEAYEMVLDGLRPKNVRRAWQVVGEYGSGKSSFAIYVANKLKKNGYTPLLVNNTGDAIEDYLTTLNKTLGTKYRKVNIKDQLGLLQKQVGKTFWIFDEMGRYLEAIAKTKDFSGLHLFQDLAEFAARSEEPQVSVMIVLHRNLISYLHNFSDAEKKDWFKVSGRFEELLFPYDLNQSFSIIQNVFSERTSKDHNCKHIAAWILEHFGKDVSPDSIRKLGPVQPELVPVALNLFGAYGQNERSLFSFLYEHAKDARIGIEEFFPYFCKICQNSALATQTCEFVKSITNVSAAGKQVLESIALLQLTRRVKITEEVLTVFHAFDVQPILAELKRIRMIRPLDGGYVLAGSSTFNIEHEYKEVFASVVNPTPAEILTSIHRNTLLPASKFINEKGRPTYFRLKFWDTTCDYTIVEPFTINVVVNPDSVVVSPHRFSGKTTLFAALQFAPSLLEPIRHLTALNKLKQQFPDVSSDIVLANTIQQQLQNYTTQRNLLFQEFVNIDKFLAKLEWKAGQTTSEVSDTLSKLTSTLYPATPIIHSELINRKALSTPIKTARNRLIRLCLDPCQCRKAKLGIEGLPPELVLYYTLLCPYHNIKFGSWLPEKDQALSHLFPVIIELLSEKRNFSYLIDELTKPPYGCHVPIAELCLFVFVLTHRARLFLYEDEAFIPIVEGSHWERLLRKPASFSLEMIKSSKEEGNLLAALKKHLILEDTDDTEAAAILQTVSYICKSIATLNDYARQTSRIATLSALIRDAVLAGRSPYDLLFVTLPNLLKYKDQDQLAKALAGHLQTLQHAYSVLLTEIHTVICEAVPGITSQADFKAWILPQLPKLTASEFKALAIRLSDPLQPDQWVESVATLITSKAPARWTDREVEAHLDTIALKLKSFNNYMLRKTKELDNLVILRTEECEIYQEALQPTKADREQFSSLLKNLSSKQRGALLFLLLTNE